MSKRHFTDDQKEEIIHRYQSGETMTQIGESFGAKHETISKYLKEWNVPIQSPIKRKVTPAQEIDICNRYANGESPRSLAEEFGMHVFTIREIVKANGGTLNPKGQQYRRFTNEEIERIKHMNAQGISQTVIATVLKTNQNMISRVMRENGILPYRSQHARGEKHGSWKGGKHINVGGYYEVLLEPSDPMFSMRNRQGYTPEHRLVMAKKLGRPLARNETVHHINGDKLDNRLENLQIRKGNHGNGQVYCCADCGSRNIMQCEIG